MWLFRVSLVDLYKWLPSTRMLPLLNWAPSGLPVFGTRSHMTYICTYGLSLPGSPNCAWKYLLMPTILALGASYLVTGSCLLSTIQGIHNRFNIPVLLNWRILFLYLGSFSHIRISRLFTIYTHSLILLRVVKNLGHNNNVFGRFSGNMTWNPQLNSWRLLQCSHICP